MKNIELLGPAGDIESFYATVNSGANAVYLGGKFFNARHYSDNFDHDKIKEIVKYSHNKGVKVYITLNILIKDSEIDDALEYALFLYKADVDAVIVQDLGLMYLINKMLPDFAINVSTQASIYDKYGIDFFEEYNINNFILARELNFEELSEITDNVNQKIEVFIHGALCLSYSGQCYYSSFLGGRSGNRGKCAQPCRLNYSIYDKKQNKVVKGFEEEPLLSLKDLMIGQKISKLIDVGVNSFKIEGRMKKPEYTAVIVEYYRKLIDNITNKEKNANLIELENKVNRVFNRGFTYGYLKSAKPKDMYAKISSGTSTNNNDDLNEEIKDRFKRNSLSRRNIIDFKVELFDGKTISLIASDKNNSVNIYSEEKVEKSINKPISNQIINEQLEKLGDTIYTVGKISIKRDEDIYVKKSILNKIRRDAVNKLFEKSGILYDRNKDINVSNEIQRIKYEGIANKKKSDDRNRKISLKVSKNIDLKNIDLTKIGRIYIPFISDIDINKIRSNSNLEIYLWVPNIVSNDVYRGFIKENEFISENYDGVCVNNVGAFNFFSKETKLDIHCGYFMNILNAYSTKMIEEKGAKGYTFSVESNVKDIESMSYDASTNTEIVAFSHIQLMTMKSCPMSLIKRCDSYDNCNKCTMYNKYEIRDRKGKIIKIDRVNDITRFYNNLPLSILGKIDKFKKANIDYYFVDCNFVKEIGAVIDYLYMEINNLYVKENSNINLLQENTFTRGHYFKNVL